MLDAGLLHCLTPAGQEAYVATLARVARPGALVHVLCLSQALGEDRIRELFGAGWTVEVLIPAPLLGRLELAELPAGRAEAHVTSDPYPCRP